MKKIVALILVASQIFIGGCWSRKEVNDLVIVTIIGIDKVKKPVGKIDTEVTIRAFKLAQATGGAEAGGPPPILVVRARGLDILDAIVNLNTRSSRRVFLAQTDVIVIGEDVAREGMSKVIGTLQRNRQMRLRNKLLIADGTASDILSVSAEIESGLGRELKGIAKQAQLLTGKSVDTDLKMFLEDYTALGIDAVLPRVAIDIAKRDQGETPPPSVPIEQKDYKGPRILGAAYFKKERMAGWLTERETRGLLLARGKFKGGIYVLGHKGEPHAHISLRVDRSSSKMEIKTTKDRISAVVKIKAEGDILGQSEAHMISSPEFMEEMGKELGKALKADVMKAWDISRRSHADILGIGAALHRSEPKVWRQVEKNWRDEWLPLVDLQVQVDAKIRRTGLIDDPVVVK